MGAPLPPIYRDIRRLLVHTEGVVSRFARYHKYTVGTELRQQAMQLMRGVHRAVYEPARANMQGQPCCTARATARLRIGLFRIPHHPPFNQFYKKPTP